MTRYWFPSLSEDPFYRADAGSQIDRLRGNRVLLLKLFFQRQRNF